MKKQEAQSCRVSKTDSEFSGAGIQEAGQREGSRWDDSEQGWKAPLGCPLMHAKGVGLDRGKVESPRAF